MTEDSGSSQKSKGYVNVAARRKGRMWALYLLYAIDFSADLDYQISRFPMLVEDAQSDDEAWRFGQDTVRGTHANMDSLDETIQASSPRWKIRRMDIIDRNVLRLGSFELFHRPDVPPRVVINEAVELAKQYGSETTRSFVNGILQQICTDNEIEL